MFSLNILPNSIISFILQLLELFIIYIHIYNNMYNNRAGSFFSHNFFVGTHNKCNI